MAAQNKSSKKCLVNAGGTPGEPARKTGRGGSAPLRPQQQSLTVTGMRRMGRYYCLRWLFLVLLSAIVWCLWWEELHYSWLPAMETEQPAISDRKKLSQETASRAISTSSPPIVNSISLGAIPTKSKMTSTLIPFNPSLFDTTRPFCVEWHIDTDDWWTHRPDWVVTAENETHYCFGPMVKATTVYGTAKAQFFRNLYDNQFRNNCSNLYTRGMVNQGWGSDLRGVFEGLAYGMEQQRPVQFASDDRRPWLYTVGPQAVINGTRQFVNEQAARQPAACPTKNLECYFLPMCGCTPGRSQDTQYPSSKNYDSPKGGWYLEYATRTKTFLRRRMYSFLSERAPVMRTPCTVMHVRRADIVINPWGNATRRYHPIEDYMEAARKDAILHENILLMTDDLNAISEAKFKYPQYHWMYMNRTRHRGAEGGFENQIPSGDPVEEVVALLSEISLVRHCTSIVHTFSSLPYYLRAIMSSQHGAHGVVKLDIDDALHATGGVWKDGNAESSRNVSRAYDG
jgi:hypothetical protein